ncbi:DHHC palmitoyltransferase-domain-containing protein [Catenaria anguillulae PL171]|uniref:Palmitoyltransferase n=1 Tax=Catenaria anguillulae PL171 TaxID=765915 RepID=A0A1Y2HE01_9FUNG|nr:DHHC palmitoyltransferase-domain-containing protein [Catenaria anguillulae PL171]
MLPTPASLDARAAQLQSASATTARDKRTWAGQVLLGVPDLDSPTHVAASSSFSRAARTGRTAAGRDVERGDAHVKSIPPPQPAAEGALSAPWRLVPHKWRYRGRPRIMMTAHDQRAFGFTLVLMVVLPGLYYGFVASAVWNELNMPWVVGLSIWLHVTAFLSLLMTSFSDPGVLPTFTHLHFDRSTLDASGRPDALVIPRVLDPDPYDFTYRELGFQVKYCATCKIYRGPRTFHCSMCDACIAHHDHHCPYTSNCIGRGNYRYFVTFLSHALATDVLVGVVCVLLLVHSASALPAPSSSDATTTTGDLPGMPPASAIRAFNQHPLALFLAIACGLLCLTLVPLTTYHWYLSLLNMTTHEHMRYGPDPNWRNPWRHKGLLGPWRNLVETLCRPLPRQAVLWYRRADVASRADADQVG